MSIKKFTAKVGLPRLIIGLFLIALLITAPFVGVSLSASLGNVIARVGMFSILVLSLVPMIQSGCGLNFGLPLGVIAGDLGAVTSIEFGWHGFAGILGGMLIGILFALLFGWIYGLILNSIKGDEMLIATYVGYSFTALMSILYVVMPYTNPVSVLSYGGKGLRQQVPVSDYWMKTETIGGMDKSVGYLSDFLSFPIGDNFRFPMGMFIMFAVAALIVWIFFRTKTGTAMTAVGSNPDYARASGINIDRVRLTSIMFSTAIAAVGIIVYIQSYGFVQLYTAPMTFTFQTVAAILIGGASLNKASIWNVLVGTLLFQGILTMTPVIINGALAVDVSEVLRLIITNGMIVYALTRRNEQ